MNKLSFVLPIATGLLLGCQSMTISEHPNNKLSVSTVQTDSSYDDIADGVVWQSEQHAGHYLIVTAEGDGVLVYDEQGREVASADDEALSADLVYDLAGSDVLVFAQEDAEALSFYRFNPAADEMLQPAGDWPLPFAPSGVCFYKNPTTQAATVTAISEAGDVAQFKLSVRNGQVISSVLTREGTPKPVREFNVGGELSSCVIDSRDAKLYIAEQNVGVWVYGADVENVKDRRLLETVAPLGHLIEIEDMDLTLQAEGNSVLWVADEGAGLVALQANADTSFIGALSVEGFDEVKLVSAANGGLWLGNTELEEPVYQWVSNAQVSLALNTPDLLKTIVSPWEVSVGDVTLVRVTGETDSVDDDGDAADDAAFWLNPEAPEHSVILGTNKQGGLMAYNLTGDELQYLEGGEPNNVDLRTVLTAKGMRVIAGATNRELNTLAFYEVQAANTDTPVHLLPVTGPYVHNDAHEAKTELNEVYGFCMGIVDDQLYAYVNGKSGRVEQWQIDVQDAAVVAQPVRTLSVPSQPEGCVVDDLTATLYLGEEDQGIWAFDAHADGSNSGEKIIAIDGEYLVADVEGLTLVNNEHQHWLIASSQGNNTYAVYDIAADYAPIGRFALIENGSIDGASDTDGIELVTGYISEQYPDGIFIAQDWYNIDSRYETENQNFKLVSWATIVSALSQ